MKLFERFFYPGLLTIVLIALMVRVFQLAAPSYSLDEFVTVNFASFPNWSALFWDNHPPLYYLLMKGWIALFGPWEFATRGFSLLCSLGTTITLGLWGRHLKDARLGLLLAALSVLQPLTFAYAREARMYALFEFFATLQLWMFWEYYQDVKKWRGFLITSILISITHYFSGPLLLVEGALLLTWRKNFKSRNTLWIVGLCGVVMLLFFIHQFSWSHLEWQKLKFDAEPGSRWPLQSLLLLGWGSWVGVLATLFITVLVFQKNELLKLCSTLFLSIFFICFVFAWATERAIFLPRYFIFLTPEVIMLTGLGLFELPFYAKKKGPIFVAGLLLTAGIALHLPMLYKNSKTPWRKAAKIIELTPNSVVYTTRTLAIRSPYFESKNIPVTRFLGLEQIVHSLDEGKQVWILENYFGAQAYFPSLRTQLSNRLYEIEDFTLMDDGSDPALLLHVQIPNRQEAPPHN